MFTDASTLPAKARFPGSKAWLRYSKVLRASASSDCRMRMWFYMYGNDVETLTVYGMKYSTGNPSDSGMANTLILKIILVIFLLHSGKILCCHFLYLAHIICVIGTFTYVLTRKLVIHIIADVLNSLTGSFGAIWNRMDISISAANDISILIESKVGEGDYGDIAIDDITFTPGCVFYQE